jgi:hypothetical protein
VNLTNTALVSTGASSFKLTTMKQQSADQLEFCRHLKCVDVNDVEQSSVIVQPYCVGIYVAVTLPGASIPLQLSMSYKQLGPWIKGSIKKMEKNGYTVTIVMEKLSSYLSIEEINTYILS